jgi:hypothetical protein
MLPSTLLGCGLGLGRVELLPLGLGFVVRKVLVAPLSFPGFLFKDLIQLEKTKGDKGGDASSLPFQA